MGRKLSRLATLLALLLVALPFPSTPAAAASLPAVEGRGGAVVSGHALATAAGLAILSRGGNTADAAVATALALAVVFPEAGNLGGGGFAVMRIDGEVASLDFRETAPAAARPDMFLDAEGEPIPDASLVGPLAAGVPGSPRGLWELHRRFGKLPWAEVVAPAVRLAGKGFPVDRHLHNVLLAHRDLLARFPETARVWLPDGEPPAVGSRMRLPELAATLRSYADHGPSAITEGPVATAIEAASKRHGGVLTAGDLAAYEAVWRKPIRFQAFGWEVASMGLPSSGGILLAETAGLLERLGWKELPRFGADRIHLLVESFRRAYADRFLLGDPSTTRVSPAELLSPRWLDRRAAGVDPRRATPSDRVGSWPGDRPPTEPSDTTHLSVVDGHGNLTALTFTLNALFGCGLYVPGAGFFLNDEMDDFATAPGRPNLFGLVQGEANAVRPGKRMLSSIAPTVAWRGREAVALGGRGGSMIPTNVLQVFLNLAVDGDPLQAAVDRPRIHHQWLPDRVLAEPDALSPETRAALEGRGYRIEISPRTAVIHAVLLAPDGSVEAARDPRGPGAAGVVHEE